MAEGRKRKYQRVSGINWEAVAIEECQAEIKKTIMRGVVNRWRYRYLDKTVQEIITELIEDLDSEALKEQCRNSLPKFARDVYTETYKAFGSIPKYQLKDYFTPWGQLSPEQQARVIHHAETSPPPAEMAYNRGSPGYAQYVHAAVRKAMEQIIAMTPKTDYVTHVNLRNIAEMEYRFRQHVDKKQALEARGVKLIMVPSHSNCSKRCQKWQGRVYSLDGSEGITPDGKRYVPLERATRSDEVKYIAKSSGRVHYNGLFGYNCRHEMREYTPGMRDVKIPDHVIKHQRALEQDQRIMERNVRRYKEKALLLRETGAVEAAREATAKAKEWTQKYKDFSVKNNIPYIDQRLVVIPGEKISQRKENVRTQEAKKGVILPGTA